MVTFRYLEDARYGHFKDGTLVIFSLNGVSRYYYAEEHADQSEADDYNLKSAKDAFPEVQEPGYKYETAASTRPTMKRGTLNVYEYRYYWAQMPSNGEAGAGTPPTSDEENDVGSVYTKGDHSS